MNWFVRWRQQCRRMLHESRSRAAYDAGCLDAAAREAQVVFDLAPSDPWANYLLACHSLDAGRYADALPHLACAADCWPDDPRLFYAIGLCHDYLETPRDAIDAYAKALRLAPGWDKALKNIGRNFYLLGDYPAAESVLRRYCQAAPDDKEAHDLLGYLCYRQRDFRASFAHYERARRLDPMNPKLDRNARLLYCRSATS